MHCDAGQRSDHFQSWMTGADRTVHDRGRARGAALTMKEEAEFCSKMTLDVGFGESFGSLLLYIENTSALHIAGNHTYSHRAKHIALRGIIFSCKNWWKARSASASSSRARVSWRTWAPSTLASIVTATSSSPCATNFSHFSAYFVVIYRGARTLHCSFLSGSRH